MKIKPQTIKAWKAKYFFTSKQTTKKKSTKNYSFTNRIEFKNAKVKVIN